MFYLKNRVQSIVNQIHIQSTNRFTKQNIFKTFLKSYHYFYKILTLFTNHLSCIVYLIHEKINILIKNSFNT